MICSKSIKEILSKTGIDSIEFNREFKSSLSDRVSISFSFLSAFFVVLFIVILFHNILDNGISLAIFSLLMATIVYFTKRDLKESNYFLDALLVASQIIMIYSVGSLFNFSRESALGLFIVVFFIEIAFFYIFDSEISKKFASFVALLSSMSIIEELTKSKGDISLAFAMLVLTFLLYRYQNRDYKKSDKEIITTLSTALFLIPFLSPKYYLASKESIYYIFQTITLFLIILDILVRKSRLEKVEIVTITILLLPIIILSFWIEFFAPSLLLLILGVVFATREITILGVVGVFISIGIWYYNLETTLTEKSFLMFGSGVVLILIGLISKKVLGGEDE